MSKRAISITNSEISSVFFIIGLMFTVVVCKMIYSLYVQIDIYANPGLAGQFMFMIILLITGIIFYAISMGLPNYLISKYDLNIWVDKITNPDFIGWIRFTKSKMIRNHIVKKGPLGQQKGVAHGVKADIINNGDYTITLPNGNQAVIKCDLLSHNANLERAMGWELMKKHFGIIGFKAWEKACETDNLLFEVEGEK